VLAGLAATFATPALTHTVQLPERFNPTMVRTGQPDWLPGEIHVVPDEFYLYHMHLNGTAMRYGVGVGRKGLYEPGVFTVARKAEWPWWRPTPAMIRRDPAQYAKYKNGMKGGPNNPLGARALYLYDDEGRDTYLRIHGTNAPSTIGSAVSNGCARLTNEHVKVLYDQVPVGTRVFLHPKVTTA
jgi:lipoprotein-anchoring transpeptidase ErfK/SrfK